MAIKIYTLQNAFTSLNKALIRANQNLLDLEVRDGCIQRFEYTYELAIKFIKRYIEEENPITENIDQLNFRDLLRLAAEIGLINQVEKWFIFREARNKTSHTYDERKAIEVFNVLQDFTLETQFLIKQLADRLQQS